MKDFKEKIIDGAIWTVKIFQVLNMKLDYSIDSVRHIDRVLDEQFILSKPKPGGLFGSDPDAKLFSLAAYIGEVILQHTKGTEWVWDDDHLGDLLNVGIRSEYGAMIWPMRELLKCIQHGRADGLYTYITRTIMSIQKPIPPVPKIR